MLKPVLVAAAVAAEAVVGEEVLLLVGFYVSLTVVADVGWKGCWRRVHFLVVFGVGVGG